MDRYNQLIQLLKEEKISEQERLELTKLIRTGLYDIPYKEYLREVFESANGDEISDADTEEGLRKLHRTMRMQESPATRVIPLHTSSVRRWWLAAAAVSLVLMSIVWWNSTQEGADQNTLAQHPETVEIVGKDYVRLPDGSTVRLKEGTRISYKTSFGSRNREVTLFGGEAFFDVVHDPAKPFTVRTGEVVTTVLGTAFDIRASRKDITVTVVRGKVAVGNEQEVFDYITRNEQISVNTTVSEPAFTKAPVDAARVIAWQNDYFVLDRVTIGEAVKMIEERFDAAITITNKDIEHCIINAWYVNNEVLADVIADISTLQQATYTITGNKVIISGGTGCKNN